MRRPSVRPARLSDCRETHAQVASPTRPAGQFWVSPIWMSPRRKVPVVSDDGAGIQSSRPSAKPDMPVKCGHPKPGSGRPTSPFEHQKICRWPQWPPAWRPRNRGLTVGLGAGSTRTAGPFAPIEDAKLDPAPRRRPGPSSPSSASISRTRCPFPRPPIAGLQDIAPMVEKRCVTSAVLAPIRAAALAASQPAWPPPMTMTSYDSGRAVMPGFYRGAGKPGRDKLSRRLFHVKHRVP